MRRRVAARLSESTADDDSPIRTFRSSRTRQVMSLSATRAEHPITDDDVARFEADGYLYLPRLFDGEEMELLLNIARADSRLGEDASDRVDASGASTKLCVRDDLGDDIYSAIVRCHRLVDTMERLLGEEVYHWHHKMMLKEPRVGGAWEWHQDYGYWYNDACLKPTLASCYLAVDRASRENGCLQVIRGSHHLGRVEHVTTGRQTGADLERVEEALKQMPLEYVEMDPGDTIFFHGNLLHRSDQNRSADPRWSLICCYNTRSNSPFRPSRHPAYSPLEKWADGRVLEVGRRQLSRMNNAT